MARARCYLARINGKFLRGVRAKIAVNCGKTPPKKWVKGLKEDVYIEKLLQSCLAKNSRDLVVSNIQ